MASLRQCLQAIGKPQWLVGLTLIFILALAAMLRLYRLDLIDFRFDQAYALRYAHDISEGLLWPVQPHGSVSAHPPIYLYVMALPYLFTNDFLSIVTFRVLLDVAGVGLCFLIGVRYLSQRIGLCAAFLYSIGPWAIQFARMTWPVPQPVFSSILIIGLLEIIARRNAWGWAISGIGMALVVGTHLAGVYLAPVAIIAWWLGRKTLRPIPLIIGMAPMIIVAGGYMLYDATLHFTNIKALLATFRSTAVIGLDALQYGTWLSGATHISDLTGRAYGIWASNMPAPYTMIDTIQVSALVISILTGVGIVINAAVNWIRIRKSSDKCFSDAKANVVFILLLWWFVPIILQISHSQPIMMQYLPTLLPAPFLITAVGMDGIWRLAGHVKQNTASHVARMATSSVLLIIGALVVSWQIITTIQLTSFVEKHDTVGGYGLPVRSALAAATQARLASRQAKDDPVVIVIHDYPTPWNEQAVIMNDVLADVPHRFLNSDVDGWIFRPKGVSYVFVPGTEQSMLGLLSYVSATNVVTAFTPIRTESSAGYTYVHVQGMPDLGGFSQANPTTWESGINLVDYRITQVATTVRIETLLFVTKLQPENVDFHWYNHIFDGSAKLVGVDASGIHPSSWYPGDYLLQRFDIPLQSALPDHPLYIRYGSYYFPKVSSVMVIENGKSPENGVNLPMPFPLR